MSDEEAVVPDFKKKSSMGEMYARMADIINNNAGRYYAAFPRKVAMLQISDGVNRPVEVSPGGTISLIEDEAIIAEILRYCYRMPSKAFQWTYSQVESCYRFWKAYTQPIKTTKWVAFSDEKELAYNRLPWAKGIGPTPLFDELFSRLTNTKAIMQFIGSLFFPESDCQQYLWIYGKGEEGKGTLMRFLDRVFGECYASENPPTPGDKFWTANFYQKRLVVFEDCNNSRFVNSAQFKSLTGSDKIKVEEKGEAAFYCRILCKFIFISNTQPAINNKRANIRRLIYSEIKKYVGDQDPGYEARLWEEGGYFLSKCIELYLNECPTYGVIKCDNTAIEAVEAHANEVDSDFAVVFDRYFKTAEWRNGRVLGQQGHVSSKEMALVKSIEFKGNISLAQDFINWMVEQRGVEKRVVKIDGRSTRVYIGIEVNDIARGSLTAESLPKRLVSVSSTEDKNGLHPGYKEVTEFSVK